MTLTFNREKYKELLTAYLPKLIKTEAKKRAWIIFGKNGKNKHT
ncbi:MAG: hypothetical protein RLZZ203_754 [Cyanobacteriota bacterium]|jgi:hypothetical protein